MLVYNVSICRGELTVIERYSVLDRDGREEREVLGGALSKPVRKYKTKTN